MDNFAEYNFTRMPKFTTTDVREAFQTWSRNGSSIPFKVFEQIFVSSLCQHNEKIKRRIRSKKTVINTGIGYVEEEFNIESLKVPSDSPVYADQYLW